MGEVYLAAQIFGLRTPVSSPPRTPRRRAAIATATFGRHRFSSVLWSSTVAAGKNAWLCSGSCEQGSRRNKRVMNGAADGIRGDPHRVLRHSHSKEATLS